MALARVTIWVAGQVLTAAALNAEFNNILNNPLTLISPTTGNINFANNQALSFGLEILSADPGVVSSGRIIYQNVKKLVEVDDGTIIRVMPAVPSTNVTQGDLIVSASSGTGVWKVLPIGTTGQVLTVTSSNGIIGWASGLPSTTNPVLTSQGGTGQDLSNLPAGTILTISSSAAGVISTSKVALGTSGQVLMVTSNGISAFQSLTTAGSASGGAGSFTSQATYTDEFIILTTAGITSGGNFQSALGWSDRSATLVCDVRSTQGGRLLINSSDGTGGSLILSSGLPAAGNTTGILVLSTWNLQLTMIVGMISTSTGGYRFGFLSSTISVTDPKDGIFFRSSNGNASTFRAVARVNNVETIIVTTAVQTSSGNPQSFQIQISSSGTLATVITNGVTAGTFTSAQFPSNSTAMTVGFSIDTIADAANPKVMVVDGIQLVHDRFGTGSTA